ncbi:MAG: sugar transferase [Acidimicrobiales bacterium]
MAATTTGTRTESENESRSRLLALQRRSLVVGCDLTAIVVGLSLTRLVAGSLAPSLLVSSFYGLLVWGWMAAFRLYNSRLATDRGEEFARIGRSGIGALLALAVLAYVSKLEIDLRAGFLLLTFTAGSVAAGREGLRAWFARRRKAGHGLWASVLVATEADGRQLRESIEADRSSPHTILDQLDPGECANADELLTRVVGLARKVEARGVVVVDSSLDGPTANSLVRGLLEARLYVDLASNLSDISTDRLATRNLGPSVATWIAPRPRGGWRGRAKRLFDLTITVSALLVLAPVFVTVAVLVKLSSPGPVFFRQERVGRDGEPFDVLKFRSMVVNAEELLDELARDNEGAGPLFKMKSDPRVTSIGRFIRKTSLDELPQLVNVLRNEMSLVGPRPALRAEMAEWDSALYARLQVKPGITGMWQVSGRSGTSFAEYTRLDLYYVHNWSLLVDLSILAKTIPAVVKSDGAF